MIAIDLVQHLVSEGFTFYFLLRPPLRPASLGLASARLALGLSGAPFCFGSFSPSFSLVSRHSGAQWDLPMYIGSSPIANYLQHKRSFSSPWSLSATKNSTSQQWASNNYSAKPH